MQTPYGCYEDSVFVRKKNKILYITDDPLYLLKQFMYLNRE